jgi:hypothetical protein
VFWFELLTYTMANKKQRARGAAAAGKRRSARLANHSSPTTAHSPPPDGNETDRDLLSLDNDDPDGMDDAPIDSDSDDSEMEETPRPANPKKKAKLPPKKLSSSEASDDDSEDDEIVPSKKPAYNPKKKTMTNGISKSSSRNSTNSTKSVGKKPAPNSRHTKKGPPGQNSEPASNPVSEAFRQEKESRREASAGSLLGSSSAAKLQKASDSRAEAAAASEAFTEYKAEAKAKIQRDKERINQLETEKRALIRNVDEYSNLVSNGKMLDDRDEHIIKSEQNIVKVATKEIYNGVKFINNDKHLVQFGDLVMDQTKIEHLQFHDDDTKLRKDQVTLARANFRKCYEKDWVSHLNEHRNYNQVRASYVAILTKLLHFSRPHLSIFYSIILSRR